MLCSSSADSGSAVAAWLPSVVGFTAIRVLAKVFSFLRASCTEGVCNDVYRYLRRYLFSGVHHGMVRPACADDPARCTGTSLCAERGLSTPPDRVSLARCQQRIPRWCGRSKTFRSGRHSGWLSGPTPQVVDITLQPSPAHEHMPTDLPGACNDRR